MHISVIIILGLLVLGLLNCIWELYKAHSDHQYVTDFLNRFRRFCRELLVEHNYNPVLYERLIKDSSLMQGRMGQFGIAYHWQLPYSNTVYPQYQLIVNLIPMIVEQATGSLFHNNSLVRQEVRQYALNVEQALLRYSGDVEDKVRTAKKNLLNPVIWLREGVRFFIKLPFLLLVWFGILPDLSYQKIVQSFFIKFISFAVALIGFISSVVTIVTGKDQFFTMVKTWMKSKGF